MISCVTSCNNNTYLPEPNDLRRTIGNLWLAICWISTSQIVHHISSIVNLLAASSRLWAISYTSVYSNGQCLPDTKDLRRTIDDLWFAIFWSPTSQIVHRKSSIANLFVPSQVGQAATPQIKTMQKTCRNQKICDVRLTICDLRFVGPTDRKSSITNLLVLT